MNWVSLAKDRILCRSFCEDGEKYLIFKAGGGEFRDRLNRLIRNFFRITVQHEFSYILITPALKMILINTFNTCTFMFRLHFFTHLKSMGTSVFNKLMPMCAAW